MLKNKQAHHKDRRVVKVSQGQKTPGQSQEKGGGDRAQGKKGKTAGLVRGFGEVYQNQGKETKTNCGRECPSNLSQKKYAQNVWGRKKSSETRSPGSCLSGKRGELSRALLNFLKP